MSSSRLSVKRIILLLAGLAVLGTLIGAFVLTSTSLGERVTRRVNAMLNPPKPPAVAFVPTPAASTADALALLATATPAPMVAPPTQPLPTQAPTNAPAATARPTQAPTATPVPSPTFPVAALKPSTVLTGLNHEYQGWNNCGPATLAMNLTFFGQQLTQKDTAPALKPDPNDKNVGPDEMAEYARSIGMGVAYRVNGNLQTLKTLLSNDIPVIVEHWFIPEPNDEMGHYKLLRGYDEAAQTFLAHDSYNGPDIKMSYAEFDPLWKVFNRTYVVVYPQDKEPLVKAIIGADMDDKTMWERSLAGAQTDVAANQNDKFAWFNLGSVLSAQGRHDEAAKAFDQARRLNLPWRMLWYQFGPFESYMAVGRYQDVLSLADANLKNAANLEESHYYRGLALQALGQRDEAKAALQTAVKLNKNFQRAQEALDKLALR